MTQEVPPRDVLRVVVISPYRAVRTGLRAMLDEVDGLTVVQELSPAALQVSTEVIEGDVLVVDLTEDIEESVAAIEETIPGVPMVLLAFEGQDHPEQLSPTDAPGRALLSKEAGPEEIDLAIHAVRLGLVLFDPALAAGAESPGRSLQKPEAAMGLLTERELDVLRLIALGLPNKAIALQLGISEHTVKFHVGSILGRLGAASRTEAVMLAARQGLLPL